MKTVEIRGGSVDVRIRESTGEVLLVFEAADAQMKVWRLMSLDEAEAFALHIQKLLAQRAEGEGK